MPTITAYTVTASRQVVALRGGQGSRRRGGLTFGAQPVTVATTDAVGVDHVVTASQLKEILEDSQLRHRVIEIVASAEGLAKSKTTKAPAAGGADQVPPGVAKAAAAEKKAKGKAKGKGTPPPPAGDPPPPPAGDPPPPPGDEG